MLVRRAILARLLLFVQDLHLTELLVVRLLFFMIDELVWALMVIIDHIFKENVLVGMLRRAFLEDILIVSNPVDSELIIITIYLNLLGFLSELFLLLELFSVLLNCGGSLAQILQEVLTVVSSLLVIDRLTFHIS